LGLLSDGNSSIGVSPSYQSLASLYAAIADVTEIRTESPEWKPSVDDVPEAMRPDTRLVVLTNPRIPTSKYLGPGTMQVLCDLVDENDAYLLMDEVYRMLAGDSHVQAAVL